MVDPLYLHTLLRLHGFRPTIDQEWVGARSSSTWSPKTPKLTMGRARHQHRDAIGAAIESITNAVLTVQRGERRETRRAGHPEMPHRCRYGRFGRGAEPNQNARTFELPRHGRERFACSRF